MLFICQPAQLGIKFGADPPSLYKLLEHLLYLRILRFYCAAFQFGNNLFPLRITASVSAVISSFRRKIWSLFMMQ